MKKVAHVGILVKNIDVSEKFYSDVLNCEKSGIIENEDVRVAFMECENETIELVQVLNDSKSVYHSPFAHLAFEVEDVQKEFERIESMGVELVDKKPRGFSGGSLFFFLGPDGESIEFCSNVQIDPV